jgi:hypothetical protein
MAEENNLKEAIESAAASQTEEKPAEVVEESKEAKPEQEFTPDPEIEEAISFYKALKDPQQQTSIITELARRAGLLGQSETPTKSEVKKYSQLLEETLGSDYPDLKERMGKVFTAFENENNQKLLYLKQQMDLERQQQVAQEFDKEFQGFLTSNKITEATAGRMLKEIEQLPPSVGRDGKRIPLTKYLEKIHKLVSTEEVAAKQAERRVERVETNSRARATNLQSDVGEGRLKQGSRLPTVREAVQAAMQGVKFDQD